VVNNTKRSLSFYYWPSVASNRFSVTQQSKSGLGHLILENSRSHTIRLTHTHTQTHVRTPLTEWLARRRGRYLHNTQQTQQMNIHALSGIGTHDPKNHTAADLPLSRHGHWDRQKLMFNQSFFYLQYLIMTTNSETCSTKYQISGKIELQSMFVYKLNLYISQRDVQTKVCKTTVIQNIIVSI